VAVCTAKLINDMKENYFSFNNYLKERFGQRIQRISLDAGFNCPNIDGTFSKDGCIYCNNRGFSRFARQGKAIDEQIKESIDFYKERMGVGKFIAYFQSYTNTYDNLKNLKEKYDAIKKFPEIVGLFISTRPDCVDDEKIKLISEYKKDYLVWVEYGLQTTHNHILKEINRNHTYEDFLTALDLTRKYGIDVGAHIILGLPSARHEDMIIDADRLSKLDIQGIKFHILHVLQSTILEKIFKSGKLDLLDSKEYIRIICDFLERLPSWVVVLRLVSTAFGDYLVAPGWINQKQKVIEDIKKEFIKRGTYQGFYHENAGCKSKQG